ncbi:PorP/SprF family type IX secretion system membrane protein [Pedobacter sandarakinus]|uniref:PorP/SprF family type IX secretion system membrane protein n=1 Tax=Pedobacter sandarakinus TaxID=353156 RepID=UPI0022475AEE|nr:PorP/SprF family type IX secretion system membrane protein [Pedobacter sandarakinus]MCX2575100.1 PorP/SprF family type IX secretion system membrane protein [Pedobacter sandarakinus]
MKYFKILAAVLIVIINTSPSKAQIDPHFSQYYANPLWLNPALTGVTDGEYRININAKQQWSNLNSGYLTAGASIDQAPAKNLALGAMILNQTAGSINYNQLSALVSAAYRIRLGRRGEQVINFGMQAGILNKSFDASKITLGSQYNPNQGYDPGLGMNDNINSESYLAPDINVGIMFFDGSGNTNVNVFAGASVAHLTTPKDRFAGQDGRLPMRFTGHGGARFKVNYTLDIVPNFIYLRQGDAQEVAAGAYAQMMLNTESDLLIGSNYRVKDSAIAFLGIHHRSMVFGLSYDFNTSSLNRATSSRGGLELSISFTSRKGIIGPNFFCPRL